MLPNYPVQGISFFNLFYLTPDLLVLFQFLFFVLIGILTSRSIGLFATFVTYAVFLIILFFCLYVVGSFTAQVGSIDGFISYLNFLLTKYVPVFMPIVASWGYFLGGILLFVKRKIFWGL